MKKLFGVLLAVLMTFAVAGPAAATFENGNLIAVFYNEDDNTVAYDLGIITPGSTLTIDTTNLLSYFGSSVDSYDDLRVGIFAAEAGYSNWFATTSSDPAVMSTPSLSSFGAAAGNLYTVHGNADLDGDGISVIKASDFTSYDIKMNSKSTAPGYYAGFNTQPTIGEAVLSADGEFTMYVHNFDITTYDADAMVTVTTGSAVPVPAAVWLLGSGLLGAIGIRRRKA